ncbi:MAG: hypothetical protein KKF50_01295 [Nanoarchaeota archaeon]|nr:hypothetical protein [Nanoarchaeota archaeon]
MKLQKRFLRKYKDKDYYKCVINIPPMIIKEANLDYGQELEIAVEKGRIILKKKENKSKKLE